MRSPRWRISRWLPWLGLGAILGAVIGVVIVSMRPEDESVTRVVRQEPPGPVVPDVDRMRAADAREALERAGFWVRSEREPSARTPRGRVLGTSPPAATRLGVGSQVTLLVSSGRRRVRVPTLQGLSRSTAEEHLLAAGFRVLVVRRESPEPPGVVLAQAPPAGRSRPASSVVRLVVAARPAPVTVPGVTGLRFEPAVERTSAAGLAIEISHRRVRRRADIGRVLAQSLPGGQRAPRGARVTLTVGVRD